MESEGASFSQHLDSLVKIISSGKLGKSMFGWAVPEAMSEHMQDFINSVLTYPADGEMLTFAHVDQMRELVEDEATRLNAEALISAPGRKITIKYHQFELSYPCQTLKVEFRVRLNAWLKQTHCGGDSL